VPRLLHPRLIFITLLLGCCALLLGLAWFALRPGGWTPWEALILACLVIVAPWNGISFANASLGLWLLLRRDDPVEAVLPALARAPAGPPRLKTAIAVCIRNEEMAAVLPPLGRLLEGLAAAGAESRFSLWILSDTQDPALAQGEAMTFDRFRSGRADAARIQYRRRARNDGFKAGNLMDFLDHHASGHDLVLTLDADSEMSAAAVLRLVACMEADPGLALVQHLTVGRPARAAFPRLFQFGMRAGMRAWATGQAWWQQGEGPYWGHNAIVRIEPFRRHCRLEPLPDGCPILSHDQVEAVRLHAAGWRVCCLPSEEGSLEANPPTLPEYLARDRRWAAGNMQYAALLRLPGLTLMGRWQLAQAILLFLGAPAWVAILALAALNAASGGASMTDEAALLALLLVGWVTYYASKLAGYAQMLLRPALAQRYGGRGRFLIGALTELGFTTLFEPVSLFNKAMFLATLPFGATMGWMPQQRAEHGVAWADALRLLWPHTLFGLTITLVFALSSTSALFWALPFTVGLLLAVPFCVVTASPGFSVWLQARGIAATPEELRL
jgi:membrane glycosyltransferase